MKPWLAMLVLVAACTPPGGATEEGKAAPPRTVAPAPDPEPCEATTEHDVWARFAGERCDFELRTAPATVEGNDDADLVLVDLAVDGAAPASGRAPAPCERQHCVYEGERTAAGPVVVVAVQSLQSEMPSAAYLGVVAGEQLRFIDLWDGAGASVRTDATAVGPAHALAPFVCGEQLVLFAAPRAEAGAGLPPPPALVERQQVVGKPGEVPASAADCTPLGLALP